ncbi:unnamed protein product [Mytilus edulis]|uniref:Uncharacterized protein n=1 Tax=Mytilus edulis TaxID=6550 RepID=A0A8S3SP32_MYTED|nr:unnamed protein product [Mytilus edulis]
MPKALTSDVIVATEVKVHNRLGAVNIVSDTKDGKDCISFGSYNGTKTVDINSEVWLFLYIKFGDMIAVLQNRNKPSRCHIKLGIINLDPSELKSRDPESFQVDSKVACPIRWNIVQIFSKENIDGELKLYLTHTGELYFIHDSGIEGTHKCHLNDISSGISIILDLFRADASVTDYHHEESDECEEKDYDYVRPEVEISETVKGNFEFQTNNMKKNVHRRIVRRQTVIIWK